PAPRNRRACPAPPCPGRPAVRRWEVASPWATPSVEVDGLEGFYSVTKWAAGGKREPRDRSRQRWPGRAYARRRDRLGGEVRTALPRASRDRVVVAVERRSEIGLDVVLAGQHAGLERDDERVPAQLHQPRRSDALLPDHGRGSLEQRLLRNPIELPGAHIHVGAGLGHVLPGQLHRLVLRLRGGHVR